ncbi:hypothetical protein GCM10022408_00250 [Hymenobacter fastidiosus]|uniref:Uncharacterized protein n=1 Tax=Hymenobacter fastidiosus TaxID=486264 RepID=A0ABP7RAK3_9BACT
MDMEGGAPAGGTAGLLEDGQAPRRIPAGDLYIHTIDVDPGKLEVPMPPAFPGLYFEPRSGPFALARETGQSGQRHRKRGQNKFSSFHDFRAVEVKPPGPSATLPG